jgi:hypothetical protein
MKNSALLISLALAGINMGSPFSQPSRNIEVGDKALVFPPEQPKLSKKAKAKMKNKINKQTTT